jgi:hypothetical protein
MHRQGANPENMGPDDFLCDFCRRPWDGRSPMIEGHQGSLICGRCLTIAYRVVALDEGPAGEPGPICTMCLEQRAQANWRSPLHDDAFICERCIRQSAQALSKDPDAGWARPGDSTRAQAEQS